MDVRVRLPSGYDFLEQILREKLRQNFVRGSFTVSLDVSADADKAAAFVINEDLLKKTVPSGRRISGQISAFASRLAGRADERAGRRRSRPRP